MRAIAISALVVLALGCGSAPAPAPRSERAARAVAAPAVAPAAPVVAAAPAVEKASEKVASEKVASEKVASKKVASEKAAGEKRAAEIAATLGVPATEINWAPDRSRFVLVVPQKGNPAAPHRLLAYSARAGKPTELPVVGVGAPSQLAFLDAARVTYLAVAPPAKETKARTRGKKPGVAPGATTSVWVFQRLDPDAPALRCQGDRFVWSRRREHLAWVGGDADRQFVGVDGAQVYPRSGRTVIQSDPSWSSDGRSLAFIELAKRAPRLVVLVETDNPSGDTTWPLPPAARRPGLRVFWGAPGRVIVGTSPTNPLFATSFTREEGPGSAQSK